MNKYRKEICNRFEKENPDWKNKSHKAGYVSKLLEYLISKLEQAEMEKKELKSKASKLIFLHSCEEEGLSSGKPTKEDWRIAVDELADLLTTE